MIIVLVYLTPLCVTCSHTFHKNLESTLNSLHMLFSLLVYSTGFHAIHNLSILSFFIFNCIPRQLPFTFHSPPLKHLVDSILCIFSFLFVLFVYSLLSGNAFLPQSKSLVDSTPRIFSSLVLWIRLLAYSHLSYRIFNCV